VGLRVTLSVLVVLQASVVVLPSGMLLGVAVKLGIVGGDEDGAVTVTVTSSEADRAPS
jgi:hypothetical protein